jgi:hypothetical protein
MNRNATFATIFSGGDESKQALLDAPPPETTDGSTITSTLQLGFTGMYDQDEDDFVGKTFFCSPIIESGEQQPFRTPDKRHCGFLFLRTVRTGSKALSLERGSLLDVILRLQEKRLRMWEDVLSELRTLGLGGACGRVLLEALDVLGNVVLEDGEVRGGEIVDWVLLVIGYYNIHDDELCSGREGG